MPSPLSDIAPINSLPPDSITRSEPLIIEIELGSYCQGHAIGVAWRH